MFETKVILLSAAALIISAFVLFMIYKDLTKRRNSE